MRKAIQHLKTADPVMGQIIERVGPFRMTYRPASFETLVRSIVYQQLSGKAAATIYARLEHAAAGQITPEGIVNLSFTDMRSVGLSKQKAAYIADLAERTRNRELNFGGLDVLADDEV